MRREIYNCSSFFGRRPLPFGGSPLEAYPWTSEEWNHHRQSVRVAKNDAPPTEPRGHQKSATLLRDPVVSLDLQHFYFPTCQVRVVRFYVSCLPLLLVLLLLLSSPLLSFSSSSSSSSSNCDPRSTLFGAGPQSLPSMLSVPCRTSTTTIHAQCSLPDLNHDHACPVFPAGPQPRPCATSVPCRTSTTTIRAQCSLPDLNREYPRQVFPAGPQPRPSTPSVPCRTSTASIHAKCSLPDLM